MNKGKGKVEGLQEAGMDWKKEIAFGIGGAAGAPAGKRKDGSRRKEGVAGRARRKGKNGSFDLSF